MKRTFTSLATAAALAIAPISVSHATDAFGRLVVYDHVGHTLGPLLGDSQFLWWRHQQWNIVPFTIAGLEEWFLPEYLQPNCAGAPYIAAEGAPPLVQFDGQTIYIASKPETINIQSYRFASTCYNVTPTPETIGLAIPVSVASLGWTAPFQEPR